MSRRCLLFIQYEICRKSKGIVIEPNDVLTLFKEGATIHGAGMGRNSRLEAVLDTLHWCLKESVLGSDEVCCLEHIHVSICWSALRRLFDLTVGTRLHRFAGSWTTLLWGMLYRVSGRL